MSQRVHTVMGVPLFRIVDEHRARGASGWITRGDLARLAQITPEFAGQVLRAAQKERLVATNGRFWYPATQASAALQWRASVDGMNDYVMGKAREEGFAGKIYNVFGNH